MDLVLEEAEHPVGGFSLDLKGYDEATGEVVIVENQLEISDHTHLGQIITYAAGTEAATIVWVAAGFRPEHRAAIDWLNQRTDERTRVFGVAIHVVRIGASPPAPNFELVAQPNDWEKAVKKTVGQTGAVSAKAAVYREFWELVLERIRDKHPDWTRARTAAGNWCDTPTGISGVVISMAWNEGVLREQIYMNSTDAQLNAARFATLEANKTTIESAMGEPLQWDPMPGRKAARTYLVSSFTNIDDRSVWPQAADWLISKQGKLRSALRDVELHTPPTGDAKQD